LINSSGKLTTTENNYNAAKALIAAKYNNQQVDVQIINMPDTKAPGFLAKFPYGKIPVFETASGKPIYESSAIAYYGI
jgi:elongation factor 1-gamma